MSTSFQPLYKQVYDVLTQRLQEGYWKPGDLLPSEFALADELGVSQGTVRKALNQLVTEYLLDRQHLLMQKETHTFSVGTDNAS